MLIRLVRITLKRFKNTESFAMIRGLKQGDSLQNFDLPTSICSKPAKKEWSKH